MVSGKNLTRILARISEGNPARAPAKGFCKVHAWVPAKGFFKGPGKSLHFQQGAFVFNCLPSLPKLNTAQQIEQSRKQSEKKAKRNPKQSKKLSSGSGKVAKQTQQSLCHIFNITNWHNSQSRNINQNRKQHVVQGSSKRSSKVPARIPARFQQGSSKVTSLLEFSLLCFCQQNMTGIFGYDGSVRWGVL